MPSAAEITPRIKNALAERFRTAVGRVAVELREGDYDTSPVANFLLWGEPGANLVVEMDDLDRLAGLDEEILDDPAGIVGLALIVFDAAGARLGPAYAVLRADTEAVRVVTRPGLAALAVSHAVAESVMSRIAGRADDVADDAGVTP